MGLRYQAKWALAVDDCPTRNVGQRHPATMPCIGSNQQRTSEHQLFQAEGEQPSAARLHKEAVVDGDRGCSDCRAIGCRTGYEGATVA